MNIFLTGASGFVGSHLLDELLKADHHIYLLLRSPEKCKISSPKLTIIKGELESEINLNLELINSLDLVIHTAGIVHAHGERDFFNINYLGTVKLIKKLNSNSKLKFIFISSLAARGPLIEQNIDLPVSLYGQSKKMAEVYLQENAPESWVKIIIRPPMVIGPRDTAVLDIFKMVKDRIILLPGINSKNKEYSFVCVFDLVETILLAMNLTNSAKIYSSFPKNILFKELIGEINTKFNSRKLFFLHVPKILISFVAFSLSKLFLIYPHKLRLTIDKTKELFPDKWVCSVADGDSLIKQNYKYNLEKTIETTFADYKKNNWI